MQASVERRTLWCYSTQHIRPRSYLIQQGRLASWPPFTLEQFKCMAPSKLVSGVSQNKAGPLFSPQAPSNFTHRPWQAAGCLLMKRTLQVTFSTFRAPILKAASQQTPLPPFFPLFLAILPQSLKMTRLHHHSNQPNWWTAGLSLARGWSPPP